MSDEFDSDRRSDFRARWIRSMEEYYRDQYPKVMRAKVYKILPTDAKRLEVLFDVCTRDPDAWKRSVKVPDVVAVETALSEVRETYPELHPYSHNQQLQRESHEIAEDAGFDYSEEIGNLQQRVLEAARRRKARIEAGEESISGYEVAQ